MRDPSLYSWLILSQISSPQCNGFYDRKSLPAKTSCSRMCSYAQQHEISFSTQRECSSSNPFLHISSRLSRIPESFSPPRKRLGEVSSTENVSCWVDLDLALLLRPRLTSFHFVACVITYLLFISLTICTNSASAAVDGNRDYEFSSYGQIKLMHNCGHTTELWFWLRSGGSFYQASKVEQWSFSDSYYIWVSERTSWVCWTFSFIDRTGRQYSQNSSKTWDRTPLLSIEAASAGPSSGQGASFRATEKSVLLSKAFFHETINATASSCVWACWQLLKNGIVVWTAELIFGGHSELC